MEQSVKQQTMNIIESLYDQQDRKGLEKYGKLLDDNRIDEYDWNSMAMEELTDGIKYVIMENRRLRHDAISRSKIVEWLDVELELSKGNDPTLNNDKWAFGLVKQAVDRGTFNL